ncbi:MAG: hypothetical protein IJI68_10675 [Eggerthellaceae bacterium]|nr:hypothetical protein [Eggerthellaceae bacterium]
MKRSLYWAIVLALAVSACALALCLTGCDGAGQAQSHDAAASETQTMADESTEAATRTESLSSVEQKADASTDESAQLSDAAVSGPDASKITVSNLKLVELGASSEGADPIPRDYVLTGTLTNGNDQVVSAGVSLFVHELSIDEYGDETESDEVGEYALENCSATPGVLDDLFLNLKAGEARDFEYYLSSLDYYDTYEITRNGVEGFVGFASPELRVNEVTGEVTEFPDSPGMAIVADDDITISYRKEGDTTFIDATNNTDKLYSDIVVVTSYFDEGHDNAHEIAMDNIGSVRPGASGLVEVNANSGHTGGNWYVQDPRTIVVVAVEDAERPATSLAEEFDAEVVSEDGSLSPEVKITNKTGKYLESVTVTVRIFKEGSEELLLAVGNADHMAPGDEQVVEISLASSGGLFMFEGPDVADMEIYDITYTVDESKEAKAKG